MFNHRRLAPYSHIIVSTVALLFFLVFWRWLVPCHPGLIPIGDGRQHNHILIIISVSPEFCLLTITQCTAWPTLPIPPLGHIAKTLIPPPHPPPHPSSGGITLKPWHFILTPPRPSPPRQRWPPGTGARAAIPVPHIRHATNQCPPPRPWVRSQVNLPPSRTFSFEAPAFPMHIRF